MKIEDAIKRYELWAEDDRIDVHIRKEHRQMADWLKELKGYEEVYNMAIKAFEPAPSTDRPRVGEWIEMGRNEDGTHKVKCNQCDNVYKIRGHAQSIYTKYNYRFCPHCGVRMRGSRND